MAFLYTILIFGTIIGSAVIFTHVMIYYATHQKVLQDMVQADIHGRQDKTLKEHINSFADGHKFNLNYFHKNYDKALKKELQKMTEKEKEQSEPIDNRKLDDFEKRRQENSQLLQRFRDQYLD